MEIINDKQIAMNFVLWLMVGLMSFLMTLIYNIILKGISYEATLLMFIGCWILTNQFIDKIIIN